MRWDGPALLGAGFDALGIELPAVGVSGAGARHTGAVAGEEEAAALAQGEAPGLVDGLLLSSVRRGVPLVELVVGVVLDVVALAVVDVVRAMVALHGVVPGVLLGDECTGLEGGHPEAAGPLARGHHLLDVLAEGHRLHPSRPAVEDLDGAGRRGCCWSSRCRMTPQPPALGSRPAGRPTRTGRTPHRGWRGAWCFVGWGTGAR